MILKPGGKEYYTLVLTTNEDDVLTTDWEASFDAGETWTAASDLEGKSAWLVCGPDADDTNAIVITDIARTLVRLIDGPEDIRRDAPPVYIDIPFTVGQEGGG